LGDVPQPHEREINLTSGTIGNRAGGDLYIAPEITVNLVSAGANSSFFDIDAAQTANVEAVIAGTGGFTKVGAGTLLLQGANTYTGNTVVNAGTVGGLGNANSDFIIENGGTLSPGASAGTLATNDLDLQSGGTLFIELGGLTAGTEYDQVLASGDVSLSGDLVISFIDGFSPEFEDVFTIIDGASVEGTFGSVSVLNSPGYFELIYTGDQVLLSSFQIPEPSSLSLLGLGALVLLRRRRRPAAA
jgi:autotransporter-associated beta strand protein